MEFNLKLLTFYNRKSKYHIAARSVQFTNSNFTRSIWAK